MFAGHSMLCSYEDKARGEPADVVAQRIRREIPRCVSRRFAQEQKRGTLRSE
jgi:hypothetical protein